MTEDEAIGVIEQMRQKFGGPDSVSGAEQDLCREAVQTIARESLERAETARAWVEAKAALDEEANAEAEAANVKNKAEAEAESNGSKDKPLRITSPAKTDAKDGA